MKPMQLLLPLLVGLSACQAQILPPGAPSAQLMRQNSVARPVLTRGLTKAEYKFSADKTELVLTMTHDTGEVVETKTVRNPVNGSTVQTETTVKQNGAVVAKRATLPAEAELSIKVAANNGWQDVYRELKTRYQLAGLVS